MQTRVDLTLATMVAMALGHIVAGRIQQNTFTSPTDPKSSVAHRYIYNRAGADAGQWNVVPA